MLEITSSNWNLNCISDNLLSPNQNKHILDRRLDASYMEQKGDQNVDLNSQLGTIVATHPHLQLKQNSIPSPPPSLNFVVDPCLSFARFCESRISSIALRDVNLQARGELGTNVTDCSGRLVHFLGAAP